MHYSLHLDEQFTVVFMTVSHSAQMLLKLEKCIPISHVTLETVPKYANIERPTSSQLYSSRNYMDLIRAATTNRSNLLLSILKIIDNDSRYQFVGSAHSACPTSAGWSNYNTE